MNVGGYGQVRTIQTMISSASNVIVQVTCPMNLNRTAAMYQMNDQEAAMSNYPYVMNHGVMVKLNWRVGACYQS